MASPWNAKHRPTICILPNETPHLSNYTGELHSTEFHECVQRMQERKLRNQVEVEALRVEYTFPSYQTDRRWLTQLEVLGHLRLYRRTRNHRVGVLCGEYAYFLGLYWIPYPKAMALKVNKFLWNTVHDGG